MESLRNLEAMVASWYKGMPHMSPGARRWLAENAWWLVLVGVVLGSLGVFMVLFGTLVLSGLMTGFGGVVGAAVGGVLMLTVIFSLAFASIDLVIAGIAVAPLKAMQKRGWSLIFLAMLINVLSIFVSFLLQPNLVGLIWGLLVAAAGGYLLFEVRDHFHAAKKPAPKKAKA